MSSDTPGTPGGTGAGDPARVDYLEDSAPQKRSKGPLVAGAAVVTIAVVGAAAWGVTQFLSDSTTPTQAIPASAIGYIGVDIDPGKGQQLEAYQTMKKFPALEEELGLDSEGDLRQSLFDLIKEESGCDDLSFADDIEPWLGNSVAFAALPGEAEPMPFAVVEVTDQGAAEDGVATLESCGSDGEEGEDGGDPAAYDFSGDFMVFAETQEDVDRVLSETEDGSLADDETFQARVEDAGGTGFVTGYAAPEAATAFLDTVSQETDSLGGSAPSEEEKKLLEEAFDDFEGAAMSLRFADEGVELKVSAAGLVQEDLSAALSEGDTGITELPATTIAAYGIPVGDDAVAQFLEFAEKFDTDGQLEQGISEFESVSGLSVPEDVQTLLGDGFSIAVDDSVDFGGLTSGATTPDRIPAGIRIKGDPAEIRGVLEQALDAAGAPPGAVTIEEGEGALAVGLNPDYVGELAGTGDLGSDAAFDSVLSELGADQGAFFVSFEGDWLSALLGSFPGEETAKIQENIEPLQAMGFATTADETGFSYTVRVTTD